MGVANMDIASVGVASMEVASSGSLIHWRAGRHPPLFCRLKDGNGKNVIFKVFWLQNWATLLLNFDLKFMRL